LDGLQGEPGEPGKVINGSAGVPGLRGEPGFNAKDGLPGLPVSSAHETYVISLPSGNISSSVI